MTYCEQCGCPRTRCRCSMVSRVFKLINPKNWKAKNKAWKDYPLEYYFMSREEQKKYDEK